MRIRYLLFLRNLLLLSDILLLNLSFFFASILVTTHKLQDVFYFNAIDLCLYNLLWLLSGSVFGLYAVKNVRVVEVIFRNAWKTTLFQSALFFSCLYFLAQGTVTQEIRVVAFSCSFMILLLVVSRFMITYITDILYNKINIKKKVAIVGYNKTGEKLARLFNDIKSPYSFAGFFDDFGTMGNLSVTKKGTIVSPLENCINYAVTNGINEIYSTIGLEEHKMVKELLQVADSTGVRIRFVQPDQESWIGNYYTRYFDQLKVLSLRSEPLETEFNRIRKRIFDILFSSFVLIFLFSWLYPVIAIFIKLESKGTVFFKQLRTGRDNKTFWCYKFRSMTVNCENANHTSKNDSRITKIGAFLRKTSLDEIPQFLNVLKGEMSVIGPRPHMLAHTDYYKTLINKYLVRQFLKPGITGWAQVNGYRGEIKELQLMEKRVEHDIWYMENWSLMLDIRISFLTIINIAKGDKQAY